MKSFVLLLPAALLFALVAVSAPLGASAASCADFDGTCGRGTPGPDERIIPASSLSPACPVSGSQCIAPKECGSVSGNSCSTGSTCESGKTPTTSALFCPGAGICCKSSTTTTACPTSQCQASCGAGLENDPSKTCTAGGMCCVTQGTAGTGTNASNCVKNAQGQCSFKNPLAFDTVEGFLAQILSWLRSIVVALALVVIVIGGLLYITSAGDEGKAETAKKWITGAMIGLAIVFLAPTIFNELGSILGWTGTSATGAKTVAEILKSVLMFLLALAGSIALIMLVVGGFMYLFAGVDEHRAETGKDIVKYSVIGLIIIMSSYVIVQTVASLFA